MIPLGAKVVLTLAAVVFGFAVAIIKPRYDERQRQREIERRHAMVYVNPWNDSTEQNRNVETEQNSCPVCYDRYNARERLPLQLPCTHYFCRTCLEQLEARENKSCPICRSNWTGRMVTGLPICYDLIP